MSAVNIYSQISSNKRNSFLLIFLFVIVIAALGYFLGYWYGSPSIGISIAIIVSMIFTLISYYNGDKAILSMSHAKKATKREYPYLVNTVEGLAIAAGIPPPKCYVIDDSAINAFATGRNPENAAVTVTTGCLSRLNRQELEGVLAHEISHIKNYDIRMMMLTVMLVGIVVLLSDIMLRSFIYGGKKRDSKGNSNAILIVIGLVLAILSPIIANLIKLAVSRKREYLADASGAMLTRYPGGLAGALKKIRDDKEPLVEAANKATAHLFISNPLRRFKGKMNVMFSTHPDIDDRIKRLESM